MPASPAEVLGLLEEARRLSQLAARLDEHLSPDDEALPAAMREVLACLWHRGEGLPVPAIAEALGVSRQHVQVQVNALLARGLVALRNNPAHRRSPLVEIAPAGQERLEVLQRRREEHLARICAGLESTPLAWARETLARLRSALQAIAP